MVHITGLLDRIQPEVDALVERAIGASEVAQQVLYGKDFVSAADAKTLRVAIGHALGDFLHETMSPDRDSMRYAPDGKGGFTR